MSNATQYTPQEIMNAVFDESVGKIVTQTTSTNSTPPNYLTKYSIQEVLNRVFNESLGRLELK